MPSALGDVGPHLVAGGVVESGKHLVQGAEGVSLGLLRWSIVVGRDRLIR
jgi:hypothetical protein